MKELPESLDSFDPEEIKRLVGVLTDREGLAINSRDDFRRIFDDGSDGSQIEGVGVERAPIFRALWGLSDDEWRRVTGIKVLGSDAENTRLDEGEDAGSIGEAHEPPIEG